MGNAHVDADPEGWSDRQREVMAVYTRLNRANQHKMNPIPVCLIPDGLRG